MSDLVPIRPVATVNGFPRHYGLPLGKIGMKLACGHWSVSDFGVFLRGVAGTIESVECWHCQKNEKENSHE